MKRNRTHALEFVLDHRKKILKGLSALLQILEKLPDGVSVTELVAAEKAVSKKPALKKAIPKSNVKLKKKSKPRTLLQPAAASVAAPAPVPIDQPGVDASLM